MCSEMPEHIKLLCAVLILFSLLEKRDRAVLNTFALALFVCLCASYTQLSFFCTMAGEAKMKVVYN